MAVVQLVIGAFRNGAADLSVGYDDVSLRLRTVTMRNDGLPLPLTVTLSDPVTGDVFFTGTRSFGEGSVTQNVMNAGVDMVIMRGTPHLPFSVQMVT